jgi:uncharacterized RDD family membrane protein YckC
MVAYLLDLCFIAVLGLALSIVLVVLTIVSFGLLYGLWYLAPLLAFAYHTLLIGGTRSSTWGMRLMGIEVADVDGGRPSYAQALVMTLVFYVSVLGTSYLVLLLALVTKHHRTLHDLLSGTVVLRRGYLA